MLVFLVSRSTVICTAKVVTHGTDVPINSAAMYMEHATHYSIIRIP
jgi:hypothetical protein